MSETQTQTDASPGSPLASTGMARVRLVMGAIGWVCLLGVLLDDDSNFFSSTAGLALFLLPPLAGAICLMGLLARRGHTAEAAFVALLLPYAIPIHTFVALLGSALLWGHYPRLNPPSPVPFIIGLCALWMGLAWLRYLALREALDGPAQSPLWRQVRRAFGTAEMTVMVLAIALVGLKSLFIPTHHYPTVRTRIYELILAGSSAKTALTEGFQEYHTWSSTWMSSITLSPTGMVASATVGPTGQIIVYGTEPTSNAVVTMTPNVTTDDKLVWTCTGTPKKYMPASCR